MPSSSGRDYRREIAAAGKAALLLSLAATQTVSRKFRFRLTTFVRRAGGGKTALSILSGELKRHGFWVKGLSTAEVWRDRSDELAEIGVELLRRSGLYEVVDAKV